MGWNFAVRLLGRLRPAAEIVAELVRRKIARREPRACLQADHVEPGPHDRKGSHAANRSQTDDDDVRLLKVDGHGYHLSS